jgi:hypothetical protein
MASVAALAVAIFVAGIVFLAVSRVNGASFALLALTSAVLLVAAFSLPDLLKLKLGSVELEKAPVEKVAETQTFELFREVSVLRRVADLRPEMPAEWHAPSSGPESPDAQEAHGAKRGYQAVAKNNGTP